jgi:UBX domain-containing protein 1
VGGASSGMNVENPDDWVDKVRKNGNDKEAYDSTSNKIKLTVYKNGFQIDDGEFRDISVPENKKFMDEVEKGYIPQELIAQGKTELAIALEDKRKENYVAPLLEKKFQAFVGGGTSLGGVISEGLGVFKDVEFAVDPNSPSTNINIRLFNGEMITQSFNLTHTVNDIFAFVSSVAPVNGSFQLVEGFPPKPLTQTEKTIAELKLQGTTLIQRLS